MFEIPEKPRSAGPGVSNVRVDAKTFDRLTHNPGIDPLIARQRRQRCDNNVAGVGLEELTEGLSSVASSVSVGSQ